MEHWSFWLGGTALAGIPLLHMLWTRRRFSVSGRVSALVDRVRVGDRERPDEAVDEAAMLAALRAMTEAEFGADALEPVAAPAPDAQGRQPVRRAPQTTLDHGLFLIGLAMGGGLSAWSAGVLSVDMTLSGVGFARVVDAMGVPSAPLLGLGGLLVGFGTRMAGGCTSGHGLCGVSRLQSGSLVATGVFFGAGVALSLLLGGMLAP